MVDELFRKGEMREQQAVLRVLAYLPEPARYVALAAEAVRTNVLSVLEALACDNPFPARHMPELAFNQMVMKAIFNGLPLRAGAGPGRAEQRGAAADGGRLTPASGGRRAGRCRPTWPSFSEERRCACSIRTST